ncbi:MAG: PhnD/SsuA/transferrin family substrate-binding protein [Ardenticatenia bacterium]|nr:PhnD/SsuA/transferrin family substrate-binding protein [Ardenticatenia bacterium]
MKLSVCPHDIVKQMKTWLEFATYLQRALNLPVTLEPVTDFAIFYRESLPHAELAFLNPMDAWKMTNERSFRPLFRTELYDEVVFITSPDNAEATLEDYEGQVVAAVDSQFATYLGLYVLQERGIRVAGMAWQPSWLQVIRAIMKGEVQYGFLYQDFYASLSALSRDQVHVIHESHTRYTTHIMLLHPEREAWLEPVRHVLASMHEDRDGAAILETLRLKRWVPIEDLGPIEPIVTLPVPSSS